MFSYNDLQLQDFLTLLQNRGMPEGVAHKLLGFITDLKNNQEDTVTGDLQDLLGRPPVTLQEGMAQLYGF